MVTSVSLCPKNSEGDNLPDDPNTKKVRFKESEDNPEEVMVVDPTPAPSLSWKDLLMGNKIIEQKVDSGSQQSEEDFSLTEGDVKKSVINGIPSIEVSERVHQLLEKEMSTSVVLKLLGRNIGFTALQNRLYGIWRPSKPFQLMDIENGYFLAKFQSPEDYEKILFPGLPSHLYKKEILWDIGGMVGKVTKLDFNTDSRARGRYARMEWCLSCGRYGHNTEACPHVPLISDSAKVMDSSAVKLQENTVAGNGDFGPWMLVERRTRRASREDNKIGKSVSGEKSSGSRFQSLTDLEAVISEDNSMKGNSQIHQNHGQGILTEILGKSPTDKSVSAEVLRKEELRHPVGDKAILGPSNPTKIQEEHLKHFNPTFEEANVINVAVKEGVLDATKQTAVEFKNISQSSSLGEEVGGSSTISKNRLNLMDNKGSELMLPDRKAGGK
ncbi:hypothetical protein Golax_021903 [Gossypium laxum]|uniref:CCHC-type domain-containing protein n=1 Tax=Gossypium laxum TaxID=34288 RepID=A0A7J9AMK3_9ROSI|nr:hypothetical protein [Gossypium laxum]